MWGILLGMGFACLYTTFALREHANFRTFGFDLGIFEQAIRSYADGRLPVSTIRDPSLVLFGDHFSPINVLLAPFYRLFPTVETLLVAQALLFALSVVPITRIAIRMLGTGIGVVIGVCYGLSWGLQTALAFDYHEIAFAVPILAFAVEAYLRGKYRRAVAIAFLLVLVKEDLGLTVAVLGVLIIPKARRLGVFTAIGGAAAALVTVFVVIPMFSVDGDYRYLGVGGIQPQLEVFHGDRLDPAKLGLIMLVLAPTMLVALRSPLVLLTVPTLAWRLVGTNVLYWRPEFHYDAVLMPIVFLALVHGWSLLRPNLQWRWRPDLVLAPTLLLLCLAISTQFELLFPRDPAPFAESARRMMAGVPDGARISTENEIAPQLTSRARVYLAQDEYPTEWWLVFRHRQALVCGMVDEARSVEVDGDFVRLQRADPTRRPGPEATRVWERKLGCPVTGADGDAIPH